MEKILVWGTGYLARRFLEMPVLYKNYEIQGFVDNDKERWGKHINEYKIFSPKDLPKLQFDKVLICAKAYDEIRIQIINDYYIQSSIIISLKDIYEELFFEMNVQYMNSDDEYIKSNLVDWEKNGPSVFGAYHWDTTIKHEVLFDDEGWPYILFENKKMFFPQNHSFEKIDGKYYVGNILSEQSMGSPHLYLKNDDDIKDGSVIVDAGTCEGNFALRYIEKAKKIYLIESDEKWIAALKKTFAPYKDKVVCCSKFLGRYDSFNTVTLDSLVNEKIDFLKMDIEGAEVDALLGGKNILRESNARCSICAYHRDRDEEYIKWVLEHLGYKTSTSEGYMFFLYDTLTYNNLDFRKGIVYGIKERKKL